MSEFQYVSFRAIDSPLTEAQLQRMRKQSSRAKITQWSFENTYNFGDFRGDSTMMLRNGYDIHLHYANFGIRTLAIRLPQGLPISMNEFSRYVDDETVVWKKDPKGPAGILTISPQMDGGSADELWEVDEHVERLVEVRQQLIDGDLRPLYLSWLCACHYGALDSELAIEPPVPAGLGRVPDSINAMIELFGLDPMVVAAAAKRSPTHAPMPDQRAAMTEWLGTIDPALLRQWMLQSLTGEFTAMKASGLKAFRDSGIGESQQSAAEGTRTYSELLELAETLSKEKQKRERTRKEEALVKRMADIAESPKQYLADVEKHVATRSVRGYQQAAQLLCEIREAVGGKKGEKMACSFASQLNKKYPTLRMLTGALRRQGLLSK